MGRISSLTELTSLANNDYLIVLDSSANIAKKITVANAFGIPNLGYTASGETWTFSSWTASTKRGVITVPTDATVKYSVGMWVKITQTTGGTKYGQIVALTSTTLTVYFATATLNNETISTPFYSGQFAVLGVTPGPRHFTDANGWVVYDYGTHIEYRKRVTYSNTVGGLTTFTISSTILPVGVSTIGNSTYFNYSVTANGNAGALCVMAELSSGSTAVSFTATSSDGVSRTYTGFIDLVLVTM